MKLTGVILAKNEEKNIKESLRSLKFCDEIIVVDDNSGDRTREIAKNYGAKVYSRSLNADFAQQRNFGIEKAKGEWIFFLDADEIITNELADEIKQKVVSRAKEVNGFYLKREDIIWGKTIKYGEAGSIALLRLAKKGKGKWKRKVHEYWDITGATEILKNPIIHKPHPTLKDFIESVNKWSSLHARENAKEGKSGNLWKIVILPFAHFTRNFIIRGGFLDGIPGFVYAVVMSLHSFLSWSKLLLLQKRSYKL